MRNMPPQITIIIPVYNVEPYLAECLDSIVNQTMRDIQIICVNDGSTDGSLSILREYEVRDSRITVLDQPNRGQSVARNAAFPLIKGKYTMFIDSDDWIDPDTCEKLLCKAQQTNADMVVFFFQLESVMENDNLPSFSTLFSISCFDKTTPEEKMEIANYTHTIGKLYDSEFLRKIQCRFPEDILIAEDNVVLWKTMTRARMIAVVPECLYHYRHRKDSTCTKTMKTHYHDFFVVCRIIYNDLCQSGYYSEYKYAFILQKLSRIVSYYPFAKSSSESDKAYIESVRQSLTEDDRKYYHTNPQGCLSHEAYLFYCISVERNVVVILRHYLPIILYKSWKSCRELLKLPEILFRRNVIYPIKKVLKIKKK